MSTQTGIEPDGDLIALARSLLAGGEWPKHMLVEYPTYSDEEWDVAFHAAIDCDDVSVMEYMIAVEAENDREKRMEYRRELLNRDKAWIGTLRTSPRY